MVSRIAGGGGGGHGHGDRLYHRDIDRIMKVCYNGTEKDGSRSGLPPHVNACRPYVGS